MPVDSLTFTHHATRRGAPLPKMYGPVLRPREPVDRREPSHQTWFVGDAGGMVNPFNGEGIDYAYETGRKVAELLAEAVTTGDGMALQQYPTWLEAEYGLYFKVARLFAQVIGQPALMRELTRVGMRSRSLMDWVLRIMANLLQPDEVGPAEAAYAMAAAIVKRVPEPLP